MTRTKTLCALALLAILAACAAPSFGAHGPGKSRTTKIGRVLVDSNGMTLYTYDKDTVGDANRPGTSACTGLCAVAWPPALAAKDSAPHDGFTLVTRADGARQWAYKGRPLYGYVSDSAPGDVTGDGADGVWHAAHP